MIYITFRDRFLHLIIFKGAIATDSSYRSIFCSSEIVILNNIIRYTDNFDEVGICNSTQTKTICIKNENIGIKFKLMYINHIETTGETL